MRILVLSDIHANLEALESALSQTTFDTVWVLGDLVGYGADPDAVVEKIREIEPPLIIRGNHDKVCSGLESPQDFSPLARQSAYWTLRHMQKPLRQYLQNLPSGPVNFENFLLCHGSPIDEDEYVLSLYQVAALFSLQTSQVCFFGHTHVPVIYSADDEEIYEEPVLDSRELPLDQSCRYFINPGSIGQPRDGDPRGCMVLLDTDNSIVQFIKFDYAIDEAASKIRRAGLPKALADRLYWGR